MKLIIGSDIQGFQHQTTSKKETWGPFLIIKKGQKKIIWKRKSFLIFSRKIYSRSVAVFC